MQKKIKDDLVKNGISKERVLLVEHFIDHPAMRLQDTIKEYERNVTERQHLVEEIELVLDSILTIEGLDDE